MNKSINHDFRKLILSQHGDLDREIMVIDSGSMSESGDHTTGLITWIDMAIKIQRAST